MGATNMKSIFLLNLIFVASTFGGRPDPENLIARFDELEQKVNGLAKEKADLEARVAKLEQLAKTTIRRSCDELADFGVTKSGYYDVDPDGPGVGQAPITVFCDFETGTTHVMHKDSDLEIEATHCDSPKCFNNTLTYQASPEQMEALVQLSDRCSQTLKISCVSGNQTHNQFGLDFKSFFVAPLQLLGVNLASWTDKNNKEQIFFDGNAEDVHVCSCFEDESCVNQNDLGNTCNCDADLPETFVDDGKIEAKDLLPIKAVTYGPLEYPLQSLIFTVGDLVCEGRFWEKYSKVMVSRIFLGKRKEAEDEVSCNTLKRRGYFEDGLYNLWDAGEAYPRLARCDMTSNGDYDSNSMETSIGYLDLSTGPESVYFSAQQSNQGWISGPMTVIFETVIAISSGENGYDPRTGYFTAPVGGTYAFSFYFISRYFQDEVENVHIDIKLNGATFSTVDGPSKVYISSVSHSWIMNLKYGDNVNLYINSHNELFSNEDHFNTFTGFLL